MASFCNLDGGIRNDQKTRAAHRCFFGSSSCFHTAMRVFKVRSNFHMVFLQALDLVGGIVVWKRGMVFYWDPGCFLLGGFVHPSSGADYIKYQLLWGDPR